MSARDSGARGGRTLGGGLVLLGLGLAANSALGPAGLGVIRYRFSHALVSQGIGLDWVSLLIVAPLAIGAGLLVIRGRSVGAVIGLPVGAYAGYMAIQYVIGPEYLALEGNNERFVPFHLALTLGGLLGGLAAWRRIDEAAVEPMTVARRRRFGAILLALGALLVLRYLPILGALVSGDPALPEYRENPTSFLLITSLDLVFALPATVAAGLALRRGTVWGPKALYGVAGWWALTGTAVAAMPVVMLLRGDPTASPGLAAGLLAAALVLDALALRLFSRLPGAAA